MAGTLRDDRHRWRFVVRLLDVSPPDRAMANMGGYQLAISLELRSRYRQSFEHPSRIPAGRWRIQVRLPGGDHVFERRASLVQVSQAGFRSTTATRRFRAGLFYGGTEVTSRRGVDFHRSARTCSPRRATGLLGGDLKHADMEAKHDKQLLFLILLPLAPASGACAFNIKLTITRCGFVRQLPVPIFRPCQT